MTEMGEDGQHYSLPCRMPTPNTTSFHTRTHTQALTLADGTTPCLAAYRLLATMRQGQGRQREAVRLLDKALGYGREEQVREAGRHARGETSGETY